MRKFISLASLLAAVTVFTAEARAAAFNDKETVFLGARPYFVDSQPWARDGYSGVNDCEIRVRVSRDIFFRRVLSFVGQEEIVPPIISKALAPNVLESDLLNKLESDGKYKIAHEGKIRERSFEIQKYFSRSGKEIWSIVISDYERLFFTTGATISCKININDPSDRPTYEFAEGRAPEAQ